MYKLLTTICAIALSTAASFAATRTIDVIPYPAEVTMGKGTFKVDGEKGFVRRTDAKAKPESYTVRITRRKVTITAGDANGFLYAGQTIKQMLLSNPDELPCCTIKDAPRFAYRGLMLDPCRHFFSVAETKKIIDAMASLKMNRLHWHLTDDQGWRIEIKKYPRLTEVGAWRDGTQVGTDRKAPHDGIRYGGFYTQEELRDVVAYAAERGITIIPEIDLPGHMVAALAAYPELGCTGGPYSVRTQWGIAEEALCPGKEAMFTFLEGVFDEVCDIFPSKLINIGGDECRKKFWQKCPDCQAKIKELGIVADDKVSAEQKLQNYVTARVQKILAAKGRNVIGWDEILEGDLAPGCAVMSWRGTEGGIKAASAGYDVVMTPRQYCYFDYSQHDDRSKEPLCIPNKNTVSLEWVYGYNPSDGFEPSAVPHILGVQANMWTEYVATPEHLEYMLFPRVFALAEVQWCDPATKDYEAFHKTLERTFIPLLDAKGYNYRKLDK